MRSKKIKKGRYDYTIQANLNILILIYSANDTSPKFFLEDESANVVYIYRTVLVK